MNIFKPGDRVVITCVPERAAMVGVSSGMSGVVLEGTHPSSGLCKVQIGQYQFWWHLDHMALAESNAAIEAINRPVQLGPDWNSLVHWVRKLVHANSGDQFTKAYAELVVLESQLPKEPK